MNRTYYKDVTFGGTLSTTNKFGNKTWFDTDGFNLTYFYTGTQSTSGSEDYYIEVDLGSIKPVDKIIIYWDYSDGRQYYRLVKHSTDGSNWTYLVGSSGTFELGPAPDSSKKIGEDSIIFSSTTNMRYIRIYGNGNTQNTDNSMYFIRVQYATDKTISSGDSITNEVVFQTFNKLQDLYSWGQLSAYDKKGWTSPSQPAGNYPSKSDIDNLRSKIEEYKGSSITWSKTIVAGETPVSAGVENELNTETNTVGANATYPSCDSYVACSCDQTCYGFSCSCDGTCYSYTTCSCDSTCNSFSCDCDTSCYSYNLPTSCYCYTSCNIDNMTCMDSITNCMCDISNYFCRTDQTPVGQGECVCYGQSYYCKTAPAFYDIPPNCLCYNGSVVIHSSSDRCYCYTVDYNARYGKCRSYGEVRQYCETLWSKITCSCYNTCYGFSCSCDSTCYSVTSCSCDSTCDGYSGCIMCHSVNYTI